MLYIYTCSLSAGWVGNCSPWTPPTISLLCCGQKHVSMSAVGGSLGMRLWWTNGSSTRPSHRILGFVSCLKPTSTFVRLLFSFLIIILLDLGKQTTLLGDLQPRANSQTDCSTLGKQHHWPQKPVEKKPKYAIKVCLNKKKKKKKHIIIIIIKTNLERKGNAHTSYLEQK